MNYGFHLSTAGVITGMRRLDTLANNLANSTTVGFKGDLLNLMARKPENLENPGAYSDTNAALDALGGGSLFQPNAIDLSQGSMRRTENPLDVAIEGDGFLQLESPKAANGAKSNDLLLTRAGALARDTQGRLVLATSGAPVLGTDGNPIVLSNDTSKVRIDENGSIFQGDDEIGQLAIVNPANVADLRKEGRDAIRLVGGKIKPTPGATRLHQNTLEDSTVDPVVTLAELVRVSRGIEFSTRLMQSQDQMTGRLLDTFGRFN
jgi:flagellar basal-body rod protein FlgF